MLVFLYNVSWVFYVGVEERVCVREQCCIVTHTNDVVLSAYVVVVCVGNTQW